MKLYMHAAACSLSPHIVCRELGLPLELIAVDHKVHRTSTDEDYLAINGNGYVPILELDDGTRIMEGPAIVQYLADLRPASDLAPPAGTLARTRLQTWLNFITSELHKPYAMLMSPDFQAAHATLIAKLQERIAWVDAQLTGPYLLGEQITVADFYLFVVLNWSLYAKVDLARHPKLVDYQRRIAARPGVQTALAAEGLAPYGADGVYHYPAKARR